MRLVCHRQQGIAMTSHLDDEQRFAVGTASSELAWRKLLACPLTRSTSARKRASPALISSSATVSWREGTVLQDEATVNIAPVLHAPDNESTGGRFHDGCVRICGLSRLAFARRCDPGIRRERVVTLSRHQYELTHFTCGHRQMYRHDTTRMPSEDVCLGRVPTPADPLDLVLADHCDNCCSP